MESLFFAEGDVGSYQHTESCEKSRDLREVVRSKESTCP